MIKIEHIEQCLIGKLNVMLLRTAVNEESHLSGTLAQSINARYEFECTACPRHCKAVMENQDIEYKFMKFAGEMQ